MSELQFCPLIKHLSQKNKGSSTKEAIDSDTNSPCQNLTECIENRMENMPSDVKV